MLYDYDSALFFLEDSTEEGSYSHEVIRPETTPVSLPYTVDYSLSEPNVLLLDMAKYAIDGETLSDNEEEILRIDTEIRRRLGYPTSRTQPWVIPTKPAEHSVTLEFTIHSDIDYAAPFLALEDADIATIVWNGEKVSNSTVGYYTDKSIEKVALPKLNKGENTLRVTIPFAERSNCEAMYLLGEFGVRVAGRLLTVTALPEKLGFSDLTYQGLPFYGGEVSYHLPVECENECNMSITVPHYTAAVNAVSVDGQRKAIIAYPPYAASLVRLSAGKHTVTVTSFISRRNCFGDVHDADEKLEWQGPTAWTTRDSLWTYEYRLRRTGIISTPIISKNK